MPNRNSDTGFARRWCCPAPRAPLARAALASMSTWVAVRAFPRDTRAGATALIVDHVWLVTKRDVLKVAAHAGSLSATLRLRELPPDADAASVEADLQATVERYVWLNLAGNLRDEALT